MKKQQVYDTQRESHGRHRALQGHHITELKRLERERKNMFPMFAHDMKNHVTTSGGFLLRLFSGKADTHKRGITVH